MWDEFYVRYFSEAKLNSLIKRWDLRLAIGLVPDNEIKSSIGNKMILKNRLFCQLPECYHRGSVDPTKMPQDPKIRMKRIKGYMTSPRCDDTGRVALNGQIKYKQLKERVI